MKLFRGRKAEPMPAANPYDFTVTAAPPPPAADAYWLPSGSVGSRSADAAEARHVEAVEAEHRAADEQRHVENLDGYRRAPHRVKLDWLP